MPFLKIIITLCCLLGAVLFTTAQQQWPARWITHPEAGVGDYAVLHFRNTFDKEESTESGSGNFNIRVSADIRYKLYLNGEYLGQGPANNDLRHYSYDTYDLADRLKTGRNVLAAVVWSFGEMNPVRYESERCRFILMSESKHMEHLNTGSGNWKVKGNQGYSATYRGKDFQIDGYYAVGGGELIDASAYPWGWEKPDFEDDKWLNARALTAGKPYGFRYGYGEAETALSARTIPMMDESAIKRPRLRSSEGISLNGTLQKWEQEKSILISANTKVSLLFDQGYLTKGHPFFSFSKGEGAKIEIAYAENLYNSDGSKGNRNVITGKEFQGLTDRYLLDGGEQRVFSPLLSRTWRYVEVKIETGSEPLTWDNYKAHKFIYPFEQTAVFNSGNALHDNILEAGWRTAKLCADETYMDTPYYEQLQYIGDTRVQALISLYYSGDDRLMRNAIVQFSNSMTDEGITQSRFPSNLLQYIPPYSLFMINMVHDYHMHRNDDAFTSGFLKKIATILFWFEDRLREDKLLGPMPWWSYVDTIDGYEKASPPGSWEGGSIVLTLQYVYALQDAIRLFRYHGVDDLAEHFDRLKTQIQQKVMEAGYDQQRKLMADTPEKVYFSQHANIFSILTNTIDPKEQPELFNRFVTDPNLEQPNIYFQFYLIRAAQQSGNGDYFITHLDLWKEMLEEGLTTYAEHRENTRSDCHAWSASPNYEFFNTVLGIQPMKAHFEEVLIAPNIGELKKVSGKIPHPKGKVEAALQVSGSKLEVEVSLPEGTSGVFRWKGKESLLKAGKNRFTVPVN